MEFSTYPNAIYEAQIRHYKAERLERQLKDKLAEVTNKIDYQIAFHVELKNDAQRKAMRIELMSHSEYREAIERLRAAEYDLRVAQIELELLVNQFTVAKLEKRELIAAYEQQAA